LETTAVRKILLKTLGLSGAIVALALFGYAAQAQAPKKEPAPKAAKAPAPPKCTGLKEEAACTARDDCVWTPGKGKKKGSCKAKPKAKAAPVKKEPPKKDKK
jgi:hypothetical protein